MAEHELTASLIYEDLREAIDRIAREVQVSVDSQFLFGAKGLFDPGQALARIAILPPDAAPVVIGLVEPVRPGRRAIDL